MPKIVNLKPAAPWQEIRSTPADWDKAGADALLRMHRDLHLVRAFEEQVLELKNEDLVHGPDIIELSQHTGRSVGEVSGVFFRLGRSIRIDWLEQRIAAIETSNRWERYASWAADPRSR